MQESSNIRSRIQRLEALLDELLEQLLSREASCKDNSIYIYIHIYIPYIYIYTGTQYVNMCIDACILI